MTEQIHPARLLHDRLPVVYTAHSAHTAFMKHHICQFVLQQEHVPINPFMNFEYFLLDVVPRDVVRRGNNSYIYIADAVWTFGVIADGVLEEVRLAKKLGKQIRHFALGKRLDTIVAMDVADLQYEPGVARIETI